MNSGQPTKLPSSFYARPTLEVAPDLIGKFLVFRSREASCVARIVEVEAYIGIDDPACHASRGLTERTRPMFGPPGFTYVYLIYGMYHCLNFVTEADGHPAAVLIRAAEPVEGMDTLLGAKSAKDNAPKFLAGPGKLCRGLGLTTAHNNLDLTGEAIYCEDRQSRPARITTSRRIGIKVGTQRRWRFCDADSRSLSRPATDKA
jgi:DNA-3-methyladenine glycosylase